MRALGLSLVVISLCFSTGGVALRSHAGPEAAAKAPADDAEQAQCRAPRTRSASATLVIPDRDAAKSFVPLNGQGYNYGDPGAWRPPVANGRTPPPAGVPAAAQE
jgi:hypothetical protein